MNLQILSGFQLSAILQSPEHVQVGCAYYIVIALSLLLLGLSKEREVAFIFSDDAVVLLSLIHI